MVRVVRSPRIQEETIPKNGIYGGLCFKFSELHF